MTDHQHLTILLQGVQAWNQWKLEHRNIQPDFSGAQLRFADLRGAYLTEAQLNGADLSNADLSGADLRWADLSNANLYKANFTDANLHEANLCKAHLKECIFLRSIAQNVNFAEANLSEASFRQANLVGANLSRHAILRKTDFTNADLRAADLSSSDLREATFYRADLSVAVLQKADLRGADLSKATLSATNLDEADISGCRVYGISAWDVKLEKTTQSGLIISSPLDPTKDVLWAMRGRLNFSGEDPVFLEDDQGPLITVDNLELAQFIHLLLNHKKLRDVLNVITERGVLLLGRFGGGGLEVLQALAAVLRKEKYLPIIFDFERPRFRNYTETVKILAGLSRFIIADLSGPSVPAELQATVPFFKIPLIPIIEAGRNQFALAVDILEHSWVIKPPVTFANTEELLGLAPSKIIIPAEEKHRERQKALNEMFNHE